MSARIDQRDVVERMFDIASTAEWDLTHDVPANRCECGATLLIAWAGGFVCAGCGLVPTYWLHPAPLQAQPWGERERGVPPETSVLTSARKGAVPSAVSTGRRAAALSAAWAFASRSLNFLFAARRRA